MVFSIYSLWCVCIFRQHVHSHNEIWTDDVFVLRCSKCGCSFYHFWKVKEWKTKATRKKKKTCERKKDDTMRNRITGRKSTIAWDIGVARNEYELSIYGMWNNATMSVVMLHTSIMDSAKMKSVYDDDVFACVCVCMCACASKCFRFFAGALGKWSNAASRCRLLTAYIHPRPCIKIAFSALYKYD